MEIELVDFDINYYQTISDRDKIVHPSEYSIYHIINIDGKRCGIIGYIPLKTDSHIGFVKDSMETINTLRNSGYLKKSQVRLYKNF
ncbi:hypothetical protein JW887_01715 [Candidatus Dojkabacteria bacterium]|nr:hypothetical protein [Candidatus Dojkabacteria bacterium]